MASNARSDGEGSIYFDKAKGRHVGVLVVDWRDGKPIRRKVSAKSRAGAASKLRELRDKINAGTIPSGRTPTVGEWVTHWLDEIAATKIRPSTLRGYRTYVDGHIIPRLGSKRIDRLTPEHVEAAWRDMAAAGLAPASIRQTHRILSRALKVAQQRGHVQRNVATIIGAPSVPDVEIEPLSLADARKVLAAATDTRLTARWTVALALGLRQGEVLGLTWEHVDLEEGTMRVRQALSRIKGQGLVLGPVKSRAGRRTVVMPDELVAQLKAHRTAQNAERLAAGSWWDDRGFVFCSSAGKPIDPRADWQAWRDLLDKAGVPAQRLHDARHTAATMLLAQGVQPRVVMEILGHSQIGITSRYQHPATEMQREAAERMGSALWGS